MRISGPKLGGANRVGSKGPAGGQGRGGQGFAVDGAAPARETAAAARTAGASSLNSVDALLALQQLEGPLERRRRATGRASRILDVLEEVKLALLDDGDDGDSMVRLRDAVREERASTDDKRLEGVLDEIETRAAVEIAKREARGRKAA